MPRLRRKGRKWRRTVTEGRVDSQDRSLLGTSLFPGVDPKGGLEPVIPYCAASDAQQAQDSGH